MAAAPSFDTWLTGAVTADPGARDAQLAAWAEAPGATIAHPPGDDEHLLPLLIAAGAADGDHGSKTFHDSRLGVSAFRFG